MPLVGSWLARGTLSGSLMPVAAPWGWSWEASFLDEEDIEAAATRKGMRGLVVGLAGNLEGKEWSVSHGELIASGFF